jgi:choline kinase
VRVVREAIILAAGTGSRLRAVVDNRPKGLIEIAGQSLVGRSIALLRDAGIRRITIVAGYRAEAYHAFARDRKYIRVLTNDAYETTGSMASLAVALDSIRDLDVLILESDIVYEARALTAVLSGAENATLLSGPTGAGDEVWVSSEAGRLLAMSKRREDLSNIAGEFVGITRLSAAAAFAAHAVFKRFELAHGHGRMDYETGALVQLAPVYSIATSLIPDLCWGEIDDELQYARVVERVWPIITGSADHRLRVQ